MSATGEGVGVYAADALTVSGPVNGGAGDVSLTSGGAPLTLNGAVVTSGDIDITVGAPLVGAALVAGAGNQLTGNNLTIVASGVGSASSRLNTSATALDATTYNGGIFVTESDALSLTATATGGEVNVRTPNGALTVGSVTGDGVTLATGGDGNSLTVNGGLAGGINGRAGDVLLTTSGTGSDIILNQGVIGTGNIMLGANGDGSNVALGSTISTTGNVYVNAGSSAHGGAIASSQGEIDADSADLSAASIGAKNAKLATNVRFLNAASRDGGIFVMEANDLTMSAHATNGELDVGSFRRAQRRQCQRRWRDAHRKRGRVAPERRCGRARWPGVPRRKRCARHRGGGNHRCGFPLRDRRDDRYGGPASEYECRETQHAFAGWRHVYQ